MDIIGAYDGLANQVDALARHPQPSAEIKRQMVNIREQIQTHIERLEGIQRNLDMEYSRMDGRIHRYEEEIARQARIRAQAPQNLENLLELFRLENKNQYEILWRIRPYQNHRWGEPRDAREIFLSSYTPNTSTDRSKANIEGEFSVLGTLRKGERESYKVTWYKQGCSGRGSFWCSCPDQKFNGSKKNIYCKHISFLLCRVANLFDPEIFRTKQLSAVIHEAFKQKVTNATVLRRVEPPVHIQPAASLSFCTGCKPVEEGDCCPICYDDLADTQLLSCPGCKNNVHKDCMEVWLERNSTCVYCRSPVWASYTR